MQTRNKIKEGIIETLKYSTLHGIQNIVKHPFKLVKLMWFICLLCSASYFLNTIFKSVSTYFDYKVDTKIEVKYLREVQFPLVKICRYDMNIPGDKKGSPVADELLYLSLLSFFRNLYKSYGTTFMKTIGIQNLSDILISCTFNLKHCNASEFGYFYDFRFGSCWQFNSGKDSNGNMLPFKASRGTGIASGLSLELYLGSGIENNNLFSIDNSFEILISNETTEALIKEGVKISSGISAHFTLEKYKMKIQPKPYSNCVDKLVTEDAYPSECYKKTLQQANKRDQLYHYTDCTYMCLQKFLMNSCNCHNEISAPFYQNIKKKCILATDIPCVQKTYAEFINNRTHLDECDCPRECEEIGYSVTSSYTNYPTKYRADFLAKNCPIVQNKFPNSSEITQRDLEKSIAKIHIYFNELKEMKISQKPKMLVFDLIAQIGSQMGVFLGMSFLSFIEIFEIIIQSLVILFKSKFL